MTAHLKKMIVTLFSRGRGGGGGGGGGGVAQFKKKNNRCSVSNNWKFLLHFEKQLLRSFWNMFCKIFTKKYEKYYLENFEKFWKKDSII